MTGFSSCSNDDDEGEDGEEEYPISSPLMAEAEGKKKVRMGQASILAMLAAAVRRSLVPCSVEPGRDVRAEIEIGRPTDVRHVAHVTFDRFCGFLGLPAELEREVAGKVPSASANVFGVSANSMQCTYDKRGNSVPIILLIMQGHLYSQGGLQTEGIFRINGENGQELHVREQLNKGIVPQGVDLHCLAGLIKAWFRELPSGVLDSLTPDQVMHCNTEEECSELALMLPPMEAALLDWAINLMTDVVQHERHNKMNARSISMVFAPNMTQMADPLTALIYAVQVMNFLRTLVVKTIRERNETAACDLATLDSRSESPTELEGSDSDRSAEKSEGGITEKSSRCFNFDQFGLGTFMLQQQQGPQSDLGEESFHSFGRTSETDEVQTVVTAGNSTPSVHANKYNSADLRLIDRLRLKGGVRKLCWHPVLQLSKPVKKCGNVKSQEERIVSWT